MRTILLLSILVNLLPQTRAFSQNKKESFIQVSGIVTSIFCDTNGNSRVGEIEPGVPAQVSCQFEWISSGSMWRLNIKEPMPPFKEGVWRSIMPFAEGGLISIASCPTFPEKPEAGGNAIVNITTKKYVFNENRFGSHVIWMGLQQKLIKDWVLIGLCRPFWNPDKRINQLDFGFHQIVRTNGSIGFWNPGKYFGFDDQGKLIYENGVPKQFNYPNPADKGFLEAQLEFMDGFLDEQRTIPKRIEFTHFVPYRGGVGGMRLAAFEKLIVECQKISHEPIPDTIFTPGWTNAFATVFDYRERLTNGLPVTYITKSRTIGEGLGELQKQKKLAEKMQEVALQEPPKIQSPTRKRPLFLLLATISVFGLPAAIWLAFIRSKKAAN